MIKLLKPLSRMFIPFMVFMILFTFCSEEAPPYKPIGLGSGVLIQVESGNFQSSNAETKLSNPIVIKITDSNENALESIEVAFSILDGGGELSETLQQSNSQGVVQVDWTLGGGPDYILKVSLVDEEKYNFDPVYLYANTLLNIETQWISGLDIVIDGDQLDHDDRIMESNHCLIFSDGSSDDEKIRLAIMAEGTLHENLHAFGFGSPAELGIFSDETSSKLRIFSNKTSDFRYGASTNPRGYYIYALDSPSLAQAPSRVIEYYRETIKHETMHLLQFLMGMPWSNFPVIWFSEGIAEVISGNRLFTPIETLAQFNQWWQVQGRLNPVSLNVISFYDLPEAAQDANAYYPMFGLAVKYLLHDQGYGKNYSDVKAMYLYMISTGTPFSEAFEIYFGMTVTDYETNFVALLTDFLTRVGN